MILPLAALSGIDWVIIGAYLLAILLVGLYASGHQTSTRDYFLGDRQIPWWAVTLSIVSTETSAVTYIGLPGRAYDGNWDVLQLVIGFVFGRLFLAAFFVRAFYDFDVITVYSYLERRFGNTTRIVAALFFLAGRMLASGARLFAACLAVSIASGMRIELAMLILGAFGIGYTLIGGIRSVIWTDCILGLTFIIGGVVSIGFLVGAIDGGVGAILQHQAFAEKFRVFSLGLSTEATSSWAGFFASTEPLAIGVVGGFFLTLATHGTDQDLVQRMLTCRDSRSGSKSLIGSAVVVPPLYVLFLTIGSLLYFAHVFNPELRPLGVDRADRYFPDFIVEHVPIGVAGLLFAGVFAAALSSLTSVLNAIASTLIADFYRPLIRKGASEEHYLHASRIATGLAGIALVAVAYLFTGGTTGVFDLAMKALTYFYGALLGVFLLAIFTKRGSPLSTVIGMGTAVPATLLLQLRAFVEAPTRAPDVVRGWVESIPTAWSDSIRSWVPLLAWPLWIVVGAACAFAIGVLGSQTITRRA